MWSEVSGHPFDNERMFDTMIHVIERLYAESMFVAQTFRVKDSREMGPALGGAVTHECQD